MMKEFGITCKLMGCKFEFIVVHTDEQYARFMLKAAIDEIKRIENLLSEFLPDSETSMLNNSAGLKPVEVSLETYRLIERCSHMYNLSQGAFDITMGPLKKLYGFKNDEIIFPHKGQIKKCLDSTGFQYIQFHEKNTVFLSRMNMHISFASIGKGYAADQVKKLWLANGIKNGIINASGDLTVMGQKANGEPWKIGIANPQNANELAFHIPLKDTSIATSGNYLQYFTNHGKRFSHTINPKNGLPVEGMDSVSVIGTSAELCDALATAVTVMGYDVGIHFISQLPNTHVIVMDQKNGIHYSQNLNVINHENVCEV